MIRTFFSAFIVGILVSCNPFMQKYDTFSEQATLEADEAVHAHNSLEWWYYTGHLEDKKGNTYGIEYVFFHFTTVGKKDNYLVNIAISDPQTEIFRYDFDFFRSGTCEEAGILPLALDKGTYHLSGQNGAYALRGNMEAHKAGFELNTTPAKDPVFQNGVGYENYGTLARAGYYSYPRLDTEGVIYLDGDTILVSGQLWYDRQWNCGSKLLSPKVSWDWMSIQFNEADQELMVYTVQDRRTDTELFGGSFHKASGEIIKLGDSDIRMTPLEYWVSPSNRKNYPIKWRVEVDKVDLDIVVEAAFPHQELILRRGGLRLPYWEGMCRAEGTVLGEPATGNAYLEMTNKLKVSRKAIRELSDEPSAEPGITQGGVD